MTPATQRACISRFSGGLTGAGLRYRRTALYPSLHPGIPPQMPLYLTIAHGKKTTLYKLDDSHRHFAPAPHEPAPPISMSPCTRLHPALIACDLRLA